MNKIKLPIFKAEKKKLTWAYFKRKLREQTARGELHNVYLDGVIVIDIPKGISAMEFEEIKQQSDELFPIFIYQCTHFFGIKVGYNVQFKNCHFIYKYTDGSITTPPPQASRIPYRFRGNEFIGKENK